MGLLLWSLWIAATAQADVPKNHYPDPIFLSKSALKVASVLGAAPPRHSAADQNDFQEIFRLQKTRTEDECKRASRVVNVQLATLFGTPDGPLTVTEVQAWSEFFERIRIDTDYFVQETKKHWGRPRPYFADPKVTPCVTREVTPAYPSGHAAISRVFAIFLAELAPRRAMAFKARADQIAADRVLAGVHHPADIAAGKHLGDQVVIALKRNPAFLKEWKKLVRVANSQ